jgi:hypothetical protein
MFRIDDDDDDVGQGMSAQIGIGLAGSPRQQKKSPCRMQVLVA